MVKLVPCCSDVATCVTKSFIFYFLLSFYAYFCFLIGGLTNVIDLSSYCTLNSNAINVGHANTAIRCYKYNGIIYIFGRFVANASISDNEHPYILIIDKSVAKAIKFFNRIGFMTEWSDFSSNPTYYRTLDVIEADRKSDNADKLIYSNMPFRLNGCYNIVAYIPCFGPEFIPSNIQNAQPI